MNIKLIIRNIVVITSLIFGCSVGFAKTQFCVTNNAGTDINLNVGVSYGFQDSSWRTSIGTLNYVPGWSFSKGDNEGCIVMSKSKNVSRSNADFDVTSKTMHIVTYDISPVVSKGNYSAIRCEKPYPTDWGYPAKVMATVSLEDGKLICDLVINPPKKIATTPTAAPTTTFSG